MREPEDLVAVQVDDDLLTAIGRGEHPGGNDPVVPVLVGWRTEICTKPSELYPVGWSRVLREAQRRQVRRARWRYWWSRVVWWLTRRKQ